jgi:NADH-quinone oxidoreductase subunit L
MHHNEDMWDMGGLKDKMPVTYATFLAGSLALAGIFPFSGFWSKDEVLYEALAHGLGGSTLLFLAWAMGLLAVFFTGFYTFRMVFLTFHGDPRTDTARDPHGVRWNVKGPLTVLGTLAVVAGFVNMVPVQKVLGLKGIDYLHGWLDSQHGEFGALSAHHYGELLHDFAHYEAGTMFGSEVTTVLISASLSLGLALTGVGLAYFLYNVPSPEPHTQNLGSVRDVVFSNYYLDEFQVWIAEGLTLPTARKADTFDQGVIDGVVNGVSSVSLFSGDHIRRIQTGVVTNYAALLALSFVVLLVAFGLAGGWLL